MDCMLVCSGSSVMYSGSLSQISLEVCRVFVIRCTVEPQFYNMAKKNQNHIVKSGYRCERTPDLQITFAGTWNVDR